MNWISGIQKAVDYVEEHITMDLDFSEIAKQAYSSSFHFQRVFGILCGFTLGDYIRMRRLTLAGLELAATNIRILDIAVKYGYDTQESFSRAFTRFHGVSPSQARNGASLKSFPRLSVKLILTGANVTDYRIEKREGFQMIGRPLLLSGKKELTSARISDFWQQCRMDGTITELSRYISEADIFGENIAGASLGKDAPDSGFPYAIGVHYNGIPADKKGFDCMENSSPYLCCVSMRWINAGNHLPGCISKFTVNFFLPATMNPAVVQTLNPIRPLT